jgi:hypothetical protein
MTSGTTTRSASAYPFLARLIFTATLAFPSLAGVAFLPGLILAAGFSPFRFHGLRNYK